MNPSDEICDNQFCVCLGPCVDGKQPRALRFNSDWFSERSFKALLSETITVTFKDPPMESVAEYLARKPKPLFSLLNMPGAE